MAQEPLISVEDARGRILAGVSPVKAETVPLDQAGGRVLAEELKATRTQPPFDASAMDGYAVRAEDVADVPVSLKIVAEIAAGTVHEGDIRPGQAARIFTGAPLPAGADTIVIQEDTTRDGDTVTVKEGAKAGTYVRARGLDFAEGDVLLKPGARLYPRHMALAASMNHTRLSVRKRPVIGILATGDELVPAGTEPGPGQIVSSNNVGIAAFVAPLGAEPLDLGIAKDNAESLAGAIRRARDADADVLVTLGGASVGEHDLVMAALEQEGLELGFWRIAMRPGKPLMFGHLDQMRVLGLPGNPVSTLVCAQLFLRPLIHALLGEEPPVKVTETAILASDLHENDQREDYLRAKLSLGGDGQLMVKPFSRQDSSMLGVLAGSDCLIRRAPHAPEAKAGESVEIVRLD